MYVSQASVTLVLLILKEIGHSVCSFHTGYSDTSRQHGHRETHNALSRQARGAADDSNQTGHYRRVRAAYFSGDNNILAMRFLRKDGRIQLPTEAFTIAFWVRPEGGQGLHTPIVDLYDHCNRKTPDSRWIVGIRTPEAGRRDARFVFSLLTESQATISHIMSNKRFEPDIWVHIAATYDGATMKLYINGARVSIGRDQDGDIFTAQTAKCKELYIGGNSINNEYFRGYLADLMLFNTSLSHRAIVDIMTAAEQEQDISDSRLLLETFMNLKQWRYDRNAHVRIVPSKIPNLSEHIQLAPPTCGNTVCDDPEVIKNYVRYTRLRKHKTMTYTVVNYVNNDGVHPLLSNKQIRDQHKALNKAFQPYNISFDIKHLNLINSTIRQRVVMFDCYPYKIGNDRCDPECAHSTTGNDGGDCDLVRTECFTKLLGNGRCDPECNKVYHNYDDGDCCLRGPEVDVNCIDPSSRLRSYMNIEDVKATVPVDTPDHLPVFFVTASWHEPQFRGLATFPWDKNVYGAKGGIIMHYKHYGREGQMTSLVHEMGHVLGLWHVHRGQSEVACDDACAETEPSMVAGDLCSDTNPTPRNTKCSDPLPTEYDDKQTCGAYTFRDTPYNNYMGYGADDCVDNFTPQQVARMHCYLDLVYQPMRAMKTPAPVPLPPKVISAGHNSNELLWTAPLGSNPDCDDDNAYYQYAVTAESSHNGVQWSPHEATGFPDADRCTWSNQAWRPHPHSPGQTCNNKQCWLQVTFKHPVVPTRLNVWLAEIRPSIQLDVVLVDTAGQRETIGHVPAYCDMETSVPVTTERYIQSVLIYTSGVEVAIDAVQLVSTPDRPECTDKPSMKYKLTRSPPLSSGYAVTPGVSFTDTEVEAGVEYTYVIEALLESRSSPPSPPLVYTHTLPFCGDGLIHSPEECDDENSLDGDGCSIDCTLEAGFACSDEPSLCYIYKDDGICEHFEVESSLHDCGIYTPDGFEDQWVTAARANPLYQEDACPADIVTGQPDLTHKCGSAGYWRPCGVAYGVIGDFWIEVYLAKPVVATAVIIHIGDDGHSDSPPRLFVQLITATNSTVLLGSVDIRCDTNPLVIPVVQDLSQPFVRTTGVRLQFTWSSISIAGVRVRFSPYIDPVTVSSCDAGQLYHPTSGTCVEEKCAVSDCGEFLMKHASVICTGSKDGDLCKIACLEGYRLTEDTDEALCLRGVWIAPPRLLCAPVECGRPDVPYATAACQDGTTFDNWCHFKCDRPAVLFGDATRLRCQSDGSWTAPLAECHVMCDALDASFYYHGKLKTVACAETGQQSGQMCKVRCDDGYHVAGAPNRKRYIRLFCGEDGRWQGPACVMNECPVIPTVFDGAYTCTASLYVGSSCSLACPGNNEETQIIACGADGVWNSDFRVCPSLSSGQCELPPADNEEAIVIDCPAGRTVGDECDVLCSKPTHVVVNKRPRKSHTMEYVTKITCSILQSWSPTPDSLSCVKRCIEPSIGDGFCDAENNRQLCQWDGGDCCPSTVPDGIVMTFPEDCPIECDCKDPAAAENREYIRHKRRKYRHLFYQRGQYSHDGS